MTGISEAARHPVLTKAVAPGADFEVTKMSQYPQDVKRMLPNLTNHESFPDLDSWVLFLCQTLIPSTEA